MNSTAVSDDLQWSVLVGANISKSVESEMHYVRLVHWPGFKISFVRWAKLIEELDFIVHSRTLDLGKC